MGQNLKLQVSAIDYMLETAFTCLLLYINELQGYLLFFTQDIRIYLYGSVKLVLLVFLGYLCFSFCNLFKLSKVIINNTKAFVVGSITSENGNLDSDINSEDAQSAGNLTRSSETIRQLPSDLDQKFINWFAGVIDGDGNFDIRSLNGKKVLKTIRIKLHVRDLRILSHIKDSLKIGRIKIYGSHATYIVSRKAEITVILNLLNGLIRLKYGSFKLACELYGIEFKEPDYNIMENDPYLSGLIDTDGSVVFNYTGNRIELNIELKHNEYSKKLCLDNVIPNAKPSILERMKSSGAGQKKVFTSIAFKYQNVGHMLHVYNYVMKNRLYCDFKFYRVSQIPRFLEIRQFHKMPYNSPEFKIYSMFLLN